MDSDAKVCGVGGGGKGVGAGKGGRGRGQAGGSWLTGAQRGKLCPEACLVMSHWIHGARLNPGPSLSPPQVQLVQGQAALLT